MRFDDKIVDTIEIRLHEKAMPDSKKQFFSSSYY